MLKTPTKQIKPTSTDTNSGAGQHTLWQVLLESMIALIAVIFVLECLFSIAGIGEQEFLKVDPVAGFAPIENKHVTWRKEGFGRASYNSHGFRGPELAVSKPEGTYRIAVLGDSYVEALQVDSPDTFCHLLESRLKKAHPGKNFEVLNCGVSSYNFGQMYLRLKDKVLQFNPDLVILTARVDTSFHLVPNAKGGFLYARPSFFLGGNGQLIQDNTVQDLWSKTREAKRIRATAWLRKHSHIWGVVSTAVETVFGYLQNFDRTLKGWGNEVAPKPPGFQSGSQNSATASAQTVLPNQSQWVGSSLSEKGATKFLWPTADALIKEINRECTTHNCKLTVVRLPGAGGHVNPLETSLLKQTAKQISAPYLDLTEPFHDALAGGREKIFYATHLTPAGHRIMADQLFEFIRAEKLIDGSVQDTSADARQHP